ncbi:hypothetical protein [Streptomyces jeddahensis]|uniref:hypothetical protein n=1 Tax=Streptomyces jeddahensis TaxID=1716141 RepID=UPI00098F0AD6|nr:hypothetical protein [Streptomyces jeddahensis]
MPSPKLRADQQLLVIRAACAAVNPVGAAELCAATGISAKNCGLVPIFAIKPEGDRPHPQQLEPLLSTPPQARPRQDPRHQQ